MTSPSPQTPETAAAAPPRDAAYRQAAEMASQLSRALQAVGMQGAAYAYGVADPHIHLFVPHGADALVEALRHAGVDINPAGTDRTVELTLPETERLTSYLGGGRFGELLAACAHLKAALDREGLLRTGSVAVLQDGIAIRDMSQQAACTLIRLLGYDPNVVNASVLSARLTAGRLRTAIAAAIGELRPVEVGGDPGDARIEVTGLSVEAARAITQRIGQV